MRPAQRVTTAIDSLASRARVAGSSSSMSRVSACNRASSARIVSISASSKGRSVWASPPKLRAPDAIESVTPLLETPSDAENFWQTVFAETYRREMRTESEATIRSLHAAAPERYDQVLRAGLSACARDGCFDVAWQGDRFQLRWPAGRREALRRRFQYRLAWAKCAYVAQLLKTAFTFGDWLPYALWKVERHTGAEIPYTERQRRHPLIFGWPLLFRILRNRELRLLEQLLGAPGQILSKQKLADRLFSYDDDASENAIEVYIGRLRKHLEASSLKITTLRGLGYRLDQDG